jgi:hypothetical protein
MGELRKVYQCDDSRMRFAGGYVIEAWLCVALFFQGCFIVEEEGNNR